MSASSILVVVRGNSGSGKSTVARALRAKCGGQLTWMEQDYLRRTVLGEHDRPGALNIELIEMVTRFALDHDRHVVLEGILYSKHYGSMLARLAEAYVGRTHHFYFDVSLPDTLARHRTRPQVADFGPDDMRSWYKSRDLLPGPMQTTIAGSSTLEESVEMIMQVSGLGR